MRQIAGFWLWLIIAIVIFGFALAVGGKIKGRFLGILIDSRNKMSLSRFQIALWTWLLVSSLFAIAMSRWTMNIEMPVELWALMGISVGSTAGAVIVKSTKAASEPDTARMPARMRAAMAPPAAPAVPSMERFGVLKTNAGPKEASLLDMFKGEKSRISSTSTFRRCRCSSLPSQPGSDTCSSCGTGRFLRTRTARWFSRSSRRASSLLSGSVMPDI